MVKLEASMERQGMGDDGIELLSEQYFSPCSYVRITHSVSVSAIQV